MDNMGISTEPSFLEVELPQTLLESPSVSNFLPDEEASICPLLSSNGGPVLSHPLSQTIAAGDFSSSQINSEDCKAETSSSDSSTGIAIDALEATSTNLFNKVNYHHLQNNNIVTNQDANGCSRSNRRKSKETPIFVSWNWNLIRKCTFFLFVSGILGMCSIVVAQILNMPKYCNPNTVWYRGSVFYEISPADFKDSDNNGMGDIQGFTNDIQKLVDLGISAVRLNSILPTGIHYTAGQTNASYIKTIQPELGSLSDLRSLAIALHAHNINLLLDLPLENIILERDGNEIIDIVSDALKFWIDHGVHGFYLKGLNGVEKNKLLNCFASWKKIVGSNRVLIVEEILLKGQTQLEVSQMSNYIDFVDVVLHIENDTQRMKNRMEMILNQIPLGDDKISVHWSLAEGSTEFKEKKVLSAIMMQLILPGTPSIRYSHERAIDQGKGQLLPEESRNSSDQLTLTSNLTDNTNLVKQMISLRKRSPSIYKNFICKTGSNKANTQIISYSSSHLLLVVRNYPRKNSFVSVSNFGSTEVNLDLSSNFYSGNLMFTNESTHKIFFQQLYMKSFDTIIVKLDK